ncbi:MAG: RluA family pseudouridine synthase [Candidatus Binatia bacterium]
MAQQIIFPQAEEPKTLQNFLKKRFPMGYVRRLFRKNAVRLNDKRSGPNQRAGPGDRIRLLFPFEKRGRDSVKKTPVTRRLEILFEDDDFFLLNKPAGIAVHEGKGILKRHSLLGILQATCGIQAVTPKLVHRIDKDTSGLLVVAKNDTVASKLEKQFEIGRVEKVYLALVMGRLRFKEGRIDNPLPGRDGRLVRALTLYRVKQEFSTTSLLEVRIKTGRRHQIRHHLAKLGHPVVMDAQHGNFAFNKQFRTTYGLKRQFLHATSITFEHRGKKRKWTIPIPDDLEKTLEALQSH